MSAGGEKQQEGGEREGREGWPQEQGERRGEMQEWNLGSSYLSCHSAYSGNEFCVWGWRSLVLWLDMVGRIVLVALMLVLERLIRLLVVVRLGSCHGNSRTG